MVIMPRRCTRLPAADQRGFTLVELLVAMVVSTIVLGGAVMVTSQIQSGYRRQIEDSTGTQEARYALDWLGKLIRGAGNNPYNRLTSECPAAGTPIASFVFDPDGDGVDNDIRIQADSNPPDGAFGGAAGACDQANEDVTITFDAANSVIVFLDNNLGGAASVRTDRVISDLRFVYRDPDREITTDPAAVAYIEAQVTTRTRTFDPGTGAPATRTLTQEFRVRGR